MIAAVPAVIELSPVNLVESVIFIALQTVGNFDLHSVFSLLKQFGGLSSAATFFEFQATLALGF